MANNLLDFQLRLNKMNTTNKYLELGTFKFIIIKSIAEQREVLKKFFRRKRILIQIFSLSLSSLLIVKKSRLKLLNRNIRMDMLYSKNLDFFKDK